MQSGGAVLVGFQDQGNLGVGYLASTLVAHGFAARILDFRQGPAAILAAVRAAQPQVVGFSLIFQYYLPQFAALAAYLRNEGVACHFTAGGHYPTLRYAEVLAAVPELDSIVLCEGELTLLELLQRLAEGADWRDLPGLTFRAESGVVATPQRTLIEDLDALPFPERPHEDLVILGHRASPVLASRGCSRACSFCSIREFYGHSPGRKVRVRDPGRVVEEMQFLFRERGVSVFLFQDDDFPVWGGFGRNWTARFIDALRAADLPGRILWKISCRADEIESNLFADLRRAGLYMVYLGLESGSDAGLRTLNKGLKVADSLRAVTVLKELELCVAYGFMMFDPDSTIPLVRANVAFLRQVTGDGRLAALFGRMLPYAGTPIEARLVAEGRFHPSVTDPEYQFLDDRTTQLFEAVNERTKEWIHGRNSVANQLNWAWQEYWMLRRLFPPLPGLDSFAELLGSLAVRANCYLLDMVETACDAIEQGHADLPPIQAVHAAADSFIGQLLDLRNSFVLENQETMLRSVEKAQVVVEDE